MPTAGASYSWKSVSIQSIWARSSLPTTFFISPAGKVVYVHTGQYLSQGTLDQDIQAHALGG